MNHKQRVITGVGLAAGLLGGGGAGLILTASGSAGASPMAVAAATAPPSTDTSATTSKADRTDRLEQVLQSLVDDGTLTQAQLDAVIAKLGSAGPIGAGAPGRGGPGFGGPGFGGRHGVRGFALETVASTLGVTVEELRTALQDGTTIATYAVTKGTTAQAVIDALGAAAKTELDARVADSTITQAEADTKLAAATAEITELVNNGTFSGRVGPHGGTRGSRQRHGIGDAPATGETPAAAPSTAPSATTPATTTPSSAPATTGS